MAWERTAPPAMADGQAPAPPAGPGPPEDRDGANWHRLGRHRANRSCAAGTLAMYGESARTSHAIPVGITLDVSGY
jgi:hypothetical protein